MMRREEEMEDREREEEPMNPTADREDEESPSPDRESADGKATTPDPEGGTSLVKDQASAIDEALQGLERRVRALSQSSSSSSPVVRDIQRAVTDIRRSAEYQRYLRAGSAVELRKLLERLFGVVDHRGRWVALEQLSRSDAEGIEAVAEFLKRFEQLIGRTIADLQTPWAQDVIMHAAAILASAVKERVGVVLQGEVIEDGRA